MQEKQDVPSRKWTLPEHGVGWVHGGGRQISAQRMTSSARRSAIMESPSARTRLGKEARTAHRLPGPRRPSRICSRRAINPDPDLPTRNAYRIIRGGRVLRPYWDPGLRGW